MCCKRLYHFRHGGPGRIAAASYQVLNQGHFDCRSGQALLNVGVAGGRVSCLAYTMVTMGGDLQPGCLADRLLTGLGQPQINPKAQKEKEKVCCSAEKGNH